MAEARAQDAIRRVREVDPEWRPRPSTYATVEGLIRTYEAEAREAEARVTELASVGVGPGPFAVEWIPARGSSRSLRESERAELNRIGATFGCHTCGALTPGTRSGNFVGDHQLPITWGQPTRIFPQCVACSNFQGGWLRQNKRDR